MAHTSRLRLEIEGRIAILVLVTLMFPNIFAQHRQLVWLQAISTCAMIVSGIVGLRAGILIKKSAEPLTPAIQKVARISATVFVVILICGIGVFAILANTRRGWIRWVVSSIFLIATLLWQRRKASNQAMKRIATD
jgi:hypothetical protein